MVLFHTNSFDFKIKHLLVIFVLSISFSTAFIMRSYPIKYGFFLNEFDPYFDYRATKFIVDNGIDAYLKWHDTQSWYPEGRDVAKSSQVALHIGTAILYQLFGFGSSLINFTIWFPVVIGSLTTIVVFALVRTLSSTTAGLFASLFFAFTPSIIQRGNLGWFKSEPFGLFLAISAIYLFISGIKNKNVKYAIIKAIFGGLLLGIANASWGGIQYFSIPLSIFFFVLPFVRNDLKIPSIVIIAFTISVIVAAGSFPRPGISFVFGLPGISLIIGTIFFIIAGFIRKISSPTKVKRNHIFLLLAFIIVGSGIIFSGSYHSSSFRYLNAINPFLSSQNPLVQSVAEHFTPTMVDYFTDYSVLLLFAGFGAWMAFNKRTDTSIFLLIIGLTGVYVSATFARLMVFSSIAIISLAAIGLYEVTRNVLERKEIELEHKGTSKETKKGTQKQTKLSSQISNIRLTTQVAFIALIVFFVSIPVIDRNGYLYPQNYNWIDSADIPPSIANGGTGFRIAIPDWVNALEWISKNTPDNSVIASWWDYGYWITTLGNKTSLADNATINQTRISTIAKMFMSDEQTGIKLAQGMKADYILVYIVANRISGGNDTSFYTLGSGGDESKKQWFIRIGGFQEGDFLENDGFTPNQNFWNNTLLGKLIPYYPVAYASFNGEFLNNMSPEYTPGSTGLYVKDIKYPENQTGLPLNLVYGSDSFVSNKPGIVFGVLVYKVNHDYKPKIPSLSTIRSETGEKSKIIPESTKINNTLNIKANMTTSREFALMETSQGPIKIEFFENAAPNHTKNFIKLAKEGFYDNIVFHRIKSGFVIQAGDPNTKSDENKSLWGTGGPGYTINAEFNDIPHERGILSMARTSDPNSAGSQFFIVLDDARFLDNQYTVFGKVVEGMDTVDKIASLPTNSNDQPIEPDKARIKSITILEK